MREAELDKLMVSSPSAGAMMKRQEEGEEFKYPEGSLSYFCKICNKGFGSGRALGGHMRAHGPLAMAAEKKEKEMIEEEEEEEEEEVGGNGSDDNNGGSLIYTLRRNPKRSWRFADREYSSVVGFEAESRPINSNSPVCDVCGKEFPSWKSLFGHMKCHSDRLWKIHQDIGDAHSQKSESQQSQDNEGRGGDMESESEGEIEQHPASSLDGISSRFDRWMKGKRSKRPRCVVQPHSPYTQQNSGQKEQFDSENNEEEDMAICLVMLASGVNAATQKLEAQDGHVPKVGEEANKVNAVGIRKRPKTKVVEANGDDACDGNAKKTRYECTTCNKTFHSYQALGGHRASHKKIKGCFSRVDVQEENESLEEEITDEELMTRSDSQLPNNSPKPSPTKEHTKVSRHEAKEESGETTIQPALVSAPAFVKKTRVHECSICHRVFTSGQALGGHKRCHWGSTGTSDTISTVSSTKELPQQQRPARLELLDLNLPAPVDDDSDGRQFNGLGGNFMNSHRPSDAETHSKITPPIFQSWWMGSYPKQGLFLYNNRSRLPIEDEADSKQGVKIEFGRTEDSQVSRAHPWLQL